MTMLDRSAAAPVRARSGDRLLTAWLRQHPERASMLALLLVALTVLLVQALLLTVPRRFGWDEATYLTQVLPDEPAAPFVAHRARGVTFLVAPVAVFGASPQVVRLWLALISSAGLFLAFRPWLRTIGFAAPLAAFLFGGNWVVQSSAVEILPNYWTALGFVATAGFVAAYLHEPASRHLYAVASGIAFTALMRPADAVLVAAGLFAVTLLWRPRLLVAVTAALAIGGLVGVAPWFGEAYVRFGWTPVDKLTRASSATQGVPADNLMIYASSLEGPPRCVMECKDEFSENPRWSLTRPSLAMMLAIAGLVGLAMARPRRAGIPAAVYVAAAGIVPHLYFYLACDCAINLRYLVPSYALLTVPVAAGLLGGLGMFREFPIRFVASALVGVVLLAWAGWQGTLTRSYLDVWRRPPGPELVAEILDRRAAGRPCAVASDWAYPQIQYWSDCLAVRLRKGKFLQGRPTDGRSPWNLHVLADGGYRIYVLSSTPRLPKRSPVTRNDWSRERLDVPETIPTKWLFTPRSPADVPLDTRL